jgi:hypothetical protein
MYRFLGILTGFIYQFYWFHSNEAHAFSLKADTLAKKLGAVGLGFIVLVVLMAFFYRYFHNQFIFGFLTATGVFFSVDIVLFHWIFQLHRITDGIEANFIEPVLVLVGIIFTFIGIKSGQRYSKSSPTTFLNQNF